MTATVKKEFVPFHPISLTITFQTQQELDGLKQLMGNLSGRDASKIAKTIVPSIVPESIYRALDSL